MRAASRPRPPRHTRRLHFHSRGPSLCRKQPRRTRLWDPPRRHRQHPSAMEVLSHHRLIRQTCLTIVATTRTCTRRRIRVWAHIPHCRPRVEMDSFRRICRRRRRRRRRRILLCLYRRQHQICFLPLVAVPCSLIAARSNGGANFDSLPSTHQLYKHTKLFVSLIAA